MAYLFASASSQHLIGGSAPVAAVPLTIAAWFRITTNGTSGTICAVGDATTHCRLSVAGGQIQALSQGSSTGISLTAGSVTVAGGWAHCAAVFSGTANRIAYLNGVAAGADTTGVTQNAFSEILIGARRLTTVGQFIGGEVAEVGVWNAVLSAAEIAALAARFRPDLIKPQNLVFYLDLIRTSRDRKSGSSLTASGGPTISPHPPRIG